MSSRLKLYLPDNWRDITSERPGGASTYARANSQNSGALQISCAWYRGGREPRPTDDALIELAKGTFGRVGDAKLLNSRSGACEIGRFGTATFESPRFPRLQSWYISNGLDFVIATHICAVVPEEAEVEEASHIVSRLAIALEG